MTSYRCVNLGDITEIVMGQAPPGADCNKDGRGHVFVKAGEFDERRPLVREWTTNPLKIARRGDVLVCVVGATAGKISEAIDCAIGRSVASVRPNPARLLSTYLYHFLSTQVMRLRAKSQGLAQGVITREMLQEIVIPIPPMAAQRRIAEILDKADALRAKRRAAFAQLDTLTQSIFLEMFGDPVTNRKGFPISAMGDVCDVRDGTHDSPKYVSDGGYPLVTSKNLSSGVVDLMEANYISEADYIQINKRSKVDPGDIVMPMIGTIGSPVLIDHEPRYAIKNVALIKFIEPSPSAVFVRHLLSCHYFDHIVSQKNRGGTQKFVSLGDLRAFPLPLPPNELQREFAKCVQAIEKLRIAHRTSLAELHALFSSVQHLAFRGEL